MDNHYAIYVIHQDIQGQLLIYSLLDYFHQLSLHEVYQFIFDLVIQIHYGKDIDSLPSHINYMHQDM